MVWKRGKWKPNKTKAFSNHGSIGKQWKLPKYCIAKLHIASCYSGATRIKIKKETLYYLTFICSKAQTNFIPTVQREKQYQKTKFKMKKDTESSKHTHMPFHSITLK